MAKGKTVQPESESREAARRVRLEAVRYRRFRVLEGGKAREASRELSVSERTLREWACREVRDGLVGRRCGRRKIAPGRHEKLEVRRFVIEHGPQVGVEPLKKKFHVVTRSALGAIVREYRDLYRRTHPLTSISLSWHVPGAVWSMDHAQGEGAGERLDIFSVEELAEKRQLIWQEVEDVGAAAVLRALEKLLEVESPPLVIKSDRGSAFIAACMKEFLSQRGIFLFFSPPRWPQYNGSLEARIRWLKCRTRYQANRGAVGRAAWRAPVMEKALEQTNELYSQKNQAAESAGGVSDGLRAAFKQTVYETIEAGRREACYSPADWPRVEKQIERYAIERALVAHDILKVRRKEIPLPIKSIFAARVS